MSTRKENPLIKDILLKTAEYLNYKEVLQLRVICKNYRQTFLAFPLNISEIYTVSAKTMQILSKERNITKLRIKCPKEIVPLPINICSTLKVLDLRQTQNIPNQINRLQLNTCPSLTTLKLNNFNLDSEATTLYTLSQLTTLILNNCTGKDFDLSKFPMLHHLTIDASIIQFDLFKLEQLKLTSLIVSGYKVKLPVLKNLTTLFIDNNGYNLALMVPKVISLEVSNEENWKFMPWIIPTITHLKLNSWSALDNLYGLNFLFRLTSLEIKDCPNLVNLKGLEECFILTKLKLINLEITNLIEVGKLKKLEFLDLSRSSRMNQLTPLAQCTALKTLILGEVHNFSTSELSNCPNLTSLSMMLFEAKIGDFTSCCRNLEVLNLTGSHIDNLTGLGDLPRLGTLTLSHCSSLISLKGIQGCSRLQNLYLNNCCNLENITPIIGHPNLRFLDLNYCLRILNYDELVNIPRLEYLDVGNNTFIWGRLRHLVIRDSLVIRH
jgi:hypothetical protein